MKMDEFVTIKVEKEVKEKIQKEKVLRGKTMSEVIEEAMTAKKTIDAILDNVIPDVATRIRKTIDNIYKYDLEDPIDFMRLIEDASEKGLALTTTEKILMEYVALNDYWRHVFHEYIFSDGGCEE